MVVSVPAVVAAVAGAALVAVAVRIGGREAGLDPLGPRTTVVVVPG